MEYSLHRYLQMAHPLDTEVHLLSWHKQRPLFEVLPLKDLQTFGVISLQPCILLLALLHSVPSFQWGNKNFLV